MTVAIVSHDAGGAEILSSYVRRKRPDCVYVLDGPARKVFERKLGAVQILSLHEAVRLADWLLCGTSWQSDLELDAFQLARAEGKRTVAFLDHWVNYRERFERGGILRLPDEIWVGDPIAFRLAQEKLPGIPVSQIDNPYVADIRQSLLEEAPVFPPPSDRLSVLYVCEPVREHALLRFGNERHWGYTEEEALRYFLTHIGVFGRPVARIVIRPHPSEVAKKYESVVREFDLPIEFSSGRTLAAEVAASNCVVGCSSMAMVVGLIGGKRVVSCIPPEGAPCSLPQPEIEHLHMLVAARKTDGP